MIQWDGDSKDAVNRHFASVTELHRTMGYIGNLSIEDVLKSVLMATLKASTNHSLCDVTTRSWMTSTTIKTYLWLSSQTIVPASFDATLTSTTLLHGITTIPDDDDVFCLFLQKKK